MDRGGLGVERGGSAQAQRKLLPEEAAEVQAWEWAKDDIEVDWRRLMPPRGFRVLARRWVVEIV